MRLLKKNPRIVRVFTGPERFEDAKNGWVLDQVVTEWRGKIRRERADLATFAHRLFASRIDQRKSVFTSAEIQRNSHCGHDSLLRRGLLLYSGIARFIANDDTKGFGGRNGFEAFRSNASGKVSGIPMPFIMLVIIGNIL